MTKPIVVYTDPAWAIGPNGQVEPARATVEAEVYGGKVDLRLNQTRGGKYPNKPAELRDLLRGAEALAIYRLTITPEILDLVGPQLRVVARQGVGFDNLNHPLLRERGIIGYNIPDYCVDEVACHTLTLALALERRLIVQHQGLVGGSFNIYHGGTPRRLRDLKAGIIGFGRIGRSVAVRLGQFYGGVQAYDPYVAGDMMAAYGVAKVGFEELLETSDVVLLHPLLDESTKNMMNADAFAHMKKGAYLVNAARGGLVDAAALRAALVEGRIAGAGLDVFTPEDPNESPDYREVLKLPNVVVTSHRAFLSEQAEASQRRRVAEGILQALETGMAPATGHLTEGIPQPWRPAQVAAAEAAAS